MIREIPNRWTLISSLKKEHQFRRFTYKNEVEYEMYSLNGLNRDCTFLLNSLRPSDAYMRPWNKHHCSDNGLSPGRRQAIIWTNVGIS